MKSMMNGECDFKQKKIGGGASDLKVAFNMQLGFYRSWN